MTNKTSLLALLTTAISFPAISAIDITDNFSISGFGSTSWAKSDNETPLLINRDISDENCFDCDTTFGVQLDYFYDAFKASVQVVKRPQDNWSEPQLEWAYLSYSIGEFEGRGGRLRLPVFLASEYYYVGQAYTTARPNEEVYNSILGVTAFNGLSVTWNHSLTDELLLSLTPFVGFKDNNEVEFNSDLTLEFETNNMWGLNGQLIGDSFRVNFAYLDSNFDQTSKARNVPYEVAPGFTTVVPYVEVTQPDQNIKLYSLGAEYDFGQLKLMAEGQTNDLSASWYGSAGYRIQKFTPYFSYGQTYSKGSDNNPYEGKNGDSWTLGIRYDVLNNVSLNAEWQTFNSFGGQSGPFVSNPGSDTDANMYTVMLNFVF
ncbi:porin [Vibrio mediterranei]|uniref:Sulfate ABC transporter permease n=1 Tax=Vibrio mediterranei TaxID=689 RepID=A0AAN1FJE5_9VIBR|nr:porin [Vibrio mediterranei]ASI91721.1 sulfate ABC transporter permease [Vibrio mediterranei]